MSFPFGGFKTPEKSRKGRYSGAQRDFIAEMKFNEGDPDPYEKNLQMLNDPKHCAKFDICWHEKINKDHALYDELHLNVWAIGQSHIDTAWLWRMYQTINKAKITFGKAAWHVLHLEDVKTVFSQPILFEWLETQHPEIFQEIQKAVKTGRFELQGGMYVEPDVRMPSGEALCRQRLYGQRYYQEKFGKIAEVEWLTDSFGYSNNLPQIISKSGGKYFFTNKIAGNYPPTNFPFYHFKWRSPDGSEIVAHITNFQFRPLTRWKTFSATRRILKKNKTLICDYSTPNPGESSELGNIWPEILIPFGVGDGGHGPSSEEIHRVRYFIQKGYLKGFISALDYFHKYDAIKDQLPVWNAADLFYNLHRGTLTTQALMKRMNRFFEWNLTALQSQFAFFQFRTGINKQKTHHKLTELWKLTLLLQFHDILPGSSAPEVYDDCYDIWVENLEIIKRLHTELLTELSNVNLKSQNMNENQANTGEMVVLNNSDASGTIPLFLSIQNVNPSIKCKDAPGKIKILALQDETGKIYPCQSIGPDLIGDKLCKRPARIITEIVLKPWCFRKFTVVEVNIAPITDILQETLEEYIFETNYLIIKVSKITGQILSYYDKDLKRNIFSAPSSVNVFRDWAMNEPAWNIGAGYREVPFEPDEFKFMGIFIGEIGPVRWSVEAKYRIIESDSVIIQRIIIWKNRPGLLIETFIIWKQHEALLKNYFTFNTHSEHIYAEGPYTSEKYTADPRKRQILDAERWECPNQTWVIFPSEDDSWGVSYWNDSKYGFDVDQDRLGITMLRGPQYPAPTGYITEERRHRNDKYPTHTDQEEHIIRYFLCPFKGSWHKTDFPKRAHFFNVLNSGGIFNIAQSHNSVNLPEKEWAEFEVSEPNIEIAAMKSREDNPGDIKSLILRVVENGRITTRASIKIPESYQVRNITSLDILESPIKDDSLKVELKSDYIISLSAEWKPHEIKTILLMRD